MLVVHRVTFLKSSCDGSCLKMPKNWPWGGDQSNLYRVCVLIFISLFLEPTIIKPPWRHSLTHSVCGLLKPHWAFWLSPSGIPQVGLTEKLRTVHTNDTDLHKPRFTVFYSKWDHKSWNEHNVRQVFTEVLNQATWQHFLKNFYIISIYLFRAFSRSSLCSP